MQRVFLKCKQRNEDFEKCGGLRKCFGYEKHKLTKVLSVPCFTPWMQVQSFQTASHIKNSEHCLVRPPIPNIENINSPNLYYRKYIYLMWEKKPQNKRKKKISISSTWNIKEKTNSIFFHYRPLPTFCCYWKGWGLSAFSLLSIHCNVHIIYFLPFQSLSEVVFSVSSVAWNVGHVTCRLSQSNGPGFSVKWNLLYGSLWPDNVSILQQVPAFHPHP